MNENTDKNQTAKDKPTRLPFWRMMLSVIQASFGVQSKENKERDFASGSIKGFIVAALIFTTIFIFVLIGVVTMVLD
jgi:hypothetical protein